MQQASTKWLIHGINEKSIEMKAEVLYRDGQTI